MMAPRTDREQVQAWAREAGLSSQLVAGGKVPAFMEALERFAAIVARDSRPDEISGTIATPTHGVAKCIEP